MADENSLYLCWYDRPQKGILDPFDSSAAAVVIECENGKDVHVKSQRQGQTSEKNLKWEDVSGTLLPQLQKLCEKSEEFAGNFGPQYHAFINDTTSLVFRTNDLDFMHTVTGDGMGGGGGDEHQQNNTESGNALAAGAEDDDLGIKAKPAAATASASDKRDLSSHFDAVVRSISSAFLV